MEGKRHDMVREEWNILQQALPSRRQDRKRLQDRRVMNGIMIVLRTSIPWRELPEPYGPYTTCCKRYNCWSNVGNWSVILERLQGLFDVDDDGARSLQTRMIASSAVRAHHHAAESLRDGESSQPSRNRSGWSTQIDAVVDGNGQPRALDLTSGQTADCIAAETLLAEMDNGMTVISDKATIRTPFSTISRMSARPPPSSRSNRSEPRMLYPRLRDAQSGRAVLWRSQGVLASRHSTSQVGPKLPVRCNSRRNTLTDTPARESKNLSQPPNSWAAV